MKSLPMLRQSRRLATTLLSAILVASAASTFAAPTDTTSPLHLNANENLFGFSPKAQEAVIKAVESGNFYNRNELDDLAVMLAKKEGVTKDYIQLTHGSGPMLLMTAATYGKPGANIVTTSPGYPQLTGAFAQRGGSIKYTPVGANLGYDFKAMLAAIDANTAIVYVCNPNNPTGVLANPTELRNFIMAVPENVLVFVDEAYLELANTDLAANTMTPLVKLRKNLIVSRTFSKGYALAGFRVGYGTGNPEVLAKVRANDTGTAPSFLAAIAAKASLADTEHLQGNIKKYREIRAYTMKELDRLGLKHSDAQGAFVIFKAGIEAKEFQKKMLEKKIQVNTVFGVAPGQEGEYKDWIRVSIGTQEDMELFIGATASILGKS